MELNMPVSKKKKKDKVRRKTVSAADDMLKQNSRARDNFSKEAAGDDVLKQNSLVRRKRRARDNLSKQTTDNTSLLFSNQSEVSESTNTFSEQLNPVNIDREHGSLPTVENNDYKQGQDFTVLGVDQFEKKKTVKRVLPYWLANPTVVSSDLKYLTTAVTDVLDINPDIIRIMENNGFTHFFPVQSVVIPWLLNSHKKSYFYRPNDLCVSAPTGSGKTLAYVIPIIQALSQRVVPQVRALVILPVCELALQVYNVFKLYSSNTNLKVVLLNGENLFQIEQKLLVKYDILHSSYRNLADIVITTPGRLVSHLLDTTGFSLKYLQYLIIDEADRLIREVESEWLFHLEKHLNTGVDSTALSVNTLEMFPRPPQKLLFSATLSQDPEKLSRLSLFQPKLFTSVVECKNDSNPVCENDLVVGDFIGKYSTPAELVEKYCVIDIENKPLALYYLIVSNNLKNVLCFTNSCLTTRRLMLLLSFMSGNLFRVKEISSSLKRRQRRAIFDDFAAGNIDVLISTDSLARGIDVPNISCVISYDIPLFVKNYIHRIGRTGRAGRSGTAILLLLPSESERFLKMLKENGNNPEEMSLPEVGLKSLEEKYQTALKKLELSLIREKKTHYKSVKKERIKSVHRSKKTLLKK